MEWAERDVEIYGLRLVEDASSLKINKKERKCRKFAEISRNHK